jgi:hypothetical protein
MSVPTPSPPPKQSQFTIRICLYILIGVTAVGLAVWRAERFRDQQRIQLRDQRVRYLGLIFDGLTRLAGFQRDEHLVGQPLGLPPLRQLRSGTEVGWRLAWAVTSTLDESPPAADQEWDSPIYDWYDDGLNELFCLEDLSDIPRDERYTRIVAVDGEGSAYNQILDEGWGDIFDRAPDAILLVEVVDSKIPWMAPGDYNPHDGSIAGKPSSRMAIGANWPPEGFLVAFVDGSIWILEEATPRNVLARFLTVSEATKYNRDAVLSPYAKMKSGPRKR